MFGKDKPDEEKKEKSVAGIPQDIQNRVEEWRRYWKKGELIEFKNERFVLVNKIAGKTIEFLIAVDDLMKEGYRLKGVVSGMGNYGGTQLIYEREDLK